MFQDEDHAVQWDNLGISCYIPVPAILLCGVKKVPPLSSLFHHLWKCRSCSFVSVTNGEKKIQLGKQILWGDSSFPLLGGFREQLRHTLARSYFGMFELCLWLDCWTDDLHFPYSSVFCSSTLKLKIRQFWGFLLVDMKYTNENWLKNTNSWV